MELTFAALENNKGYYCDVPNNQGTYSIKFKQPGGSVQLYSKKEEDSLDDLFFIDSIILPYGETNMSFKIDIDDNMDAVLITSQEVEYAEVAE